jgi:hypothetical protein
MSNDSIVSDRDKAFAGRVIYERKKTWSCGSIFLNNKMRCVKNDIDFLTDMGDSEMGSVTRAEVAEMYGVAAEEIDALVLSQIYGGDGY